MTAAQPDTSSIAPDGSSHAVHFYENDDELSARVAAFIGEALLAGDPAVIIASPPHRQQFIARLAAMNVDVEAERLAGNLTILDAVATLGKFMVGDSPDRELFTRVVGSLIESIGTRANRWVKVRAYGEMVDLLWQGANHAAAIALEEMWTDLGAIYPFDLLCAYAMAAFAEGPASAGVREICGEHSHVTVAAPGDGSTDASGAIGGVDQRSQPSRDLAAEIARRKQVEMALRSSVQELKRVQAAERERAARAKQLADDLHETIRVNELFIGVLAHDLRAPLTAIMTAAGLLRKRQAAAPDARNAKVLGRLMSSGERMSRMVEQLLDFTRLRVGGGFTIEPRDADLASLARQVVDELDDSYPDCAVDIRQTGDTRGSWDADRLCQVLSNLVANAFQHGLPAAGIRVFIDGTAPEVVRVQVHNMGAIPRALAPQMFDPLTGGQRRRDRSRGLGLGLFITQRIAARTAASVAVTSNEADGTTFTVSLPRRRRTRRRPGRARRTGAAARTEASTSPPLAQDAAAREPTRFRLLVEAVKDYAIFMLDPTGRVATWNAGAERIKGYSADEIIGQHFSRFYPRRGRPRRQVRARAGGSRRARAGSRTRAGACARTARGSGPTSSSRRCATEDGELVGFAKVTRDLTERRRRRRSACGWRRRAGGDPPARRVPVAGVARAEDAADGAAAAARHAARPHGRLPVTALGEQAAARRRRAASAWRSWSNRCSTSRASRPGASRWTSRSSIWSTACDGSSTACARPPIARRLRDVARRRRADRRRLGSAAPRAGR